MTVCSRIKRFVIYLGLVVIFTPVILLFMFTVIPKAYKGLGYDRSETVVIQGESHALNKAVIARACTHDGKTCIDDVLLVSGDLDEGSIGAIKQLDGNLQVDTVCFASRGGDKNAAIKIGQWIKSKHLNTCIAEKYLTTDGVTMSSPLCASACPYILAMGHKRTALGRDFKIGIHNSGTNLNFGLFTYKANSFEFMALRGYQPMLRESGDPSSAQHLEMLYDSLATPFYELKYLTPTEQKKYVLFTENR